MCDQQQGDWGLLPSTVGNPCVALLANDTDYSWSAPFLRMQCCWDSGWDSLSECQQNLWQNYLLAFLELLSFSFLRGRRLTLKVNPHKEEQLESSRRESQVPEDKLQNYFTFLTKAAITAQFLRSSRVKMETITESLCP